MRFAESARGRLLAKSRDEAWNRKQPPPHRLFKTPRVLKMSCNGPFAGVQISLPVLFGFASASLHLLHASR
eukprot:14498461-Alexandrium_andersonii.AAC.1